MATGHSKDDGRGWSDGNTWSDPVPLSEAVGRAPVFIRLEEGDRGATEQLSFSAGDTMALEGEKVSRGRRLVLAHYTTEQELDDIYGDAGCRGNSGLYCALLTLPYDQLPDIDVCIMEDPNGHFYSNFLATNFPDCNWKEQQEELLESLDEHDYLNVSIITPKPRKDRQRETWRLPKQAPPPPPKPKPTPFPRSQSTGDETDTCPPRPPKPTLRRDGVPPRPPRTPRHEVCHDEDQFVFDVGPDDRLSMPTIGELFGSGLMDADYLGEGSPDTLSRNRKEPNKEKPHKGKFTDKLKSKMKKVYESVSRPKSPLSSPKMARKQISTDDEYLEPISQVFVVKDNDNDISDSDSDDNYDLPDEKKMDPKYDQAPAKPPEPEKPAKKDKKGDKQKQGKKGEKDMTSRPTVRVSPQPSLGLAWSSGGSPPDRPQMPHPMMNPAPGDDIYGLDDFQSRKIVTSPLGEMTCDELCERLQKCGMPGLAKACKDNVVDGAFFVNLSDDILRKPPFSLDDFQLNTKLKMVRAGWVPK